MVERVYLLVEIFAALILLWTLHGSKKKPGIGTGIYIFVEIFIVSMVADGRISEGYLSIAYIGIVVIDILEFGDRLKYAIMYALADSMLMICGQFICGLTYSVLFQTNILSNTVIAGINIMVIFIGGLLSKLDVHKYLLPILESGKVANVTSVCLGGGLLFVFAKKASSFQLEGDLMAFMILFFGATFLIVIKLEHERSQNIQYKEQLRKSYQYNKVYEGLISEIRHRQHDFDNHLQAIYGTILSSESIEELRKEYSLYFEQLQNEHQINHLLKENSSSAMTAFLYLKFKNIKNLGIPVDYNINMRKTDTYLLFPDFVEMVGNLIDNATEAVVGKSIKYIAVSLDESITGLRCQVTNSYDWEKNGQERNFMVDTFSTKKKRDGHGYGLTNVYRIVEKYHGTLQVLLDVEKEMKIITFDIIIPYKKDERIF